MTGRRAAQACALLLALSVGKTAQATASRFELTWTSSSVARPCISEEELKRAVSARLGRAPFVQAGQGEIAVEGRELPAPVGQLRARITQRDREGHVLGTRELEATSCEELLRSATFVVFLIVDPDAALGGARLEPVPLEEKNADEPSTEDEPSPAERAARERPPIGKVGPVGKKDGSRPSEVAVSARPSAPAPRGMPVDLGLALVVSNGLLPTPDAGPALALGLEPLPLPIRFEWRAGYRIAVQAVQGYDFRAVAQEWRACYFRRVFGAMLGTACGGVNWTAILPEARELAGGDQAPKIVFSPTFGVGPAFEVEGARLFADLALTLPRPRYAFSYRDEGRVTPLHEVSRIGWSVGIGVARSFR